MARPSWGTACLCKSVQQWSTALALPLYLRAVPLEDIFRRPFLKQSSWCVVPPHPLGMRGFTCQCADGNELRSWSHLENGRLEPPIGLPGHWTQTLTLTICAEIFMLIRHRSGRMSQKCGSGCALGCMTTEIFMLIRHRSGRMSQKCYEFFPFMERLVHQTKKSGPCNSLIDSSFCTEHREKFCNFGSKITKLFLKILHSLRYVHKYFGDFSISFWARKNQRSSVFAIFVVACLVLSIGSIWKKLIFFSTRASLNLFIFRSKLGNTLDNSNIFF
jgi:hypothetical protein